MKQAEQSVPEPGKTRYHILVGVIRLGFTGWFIWMQHIEVGSGWLTLILSLMAFANEVHSLARHLQQHALVAVFNMAANHISREIRGRG